MSPIFKFTILALASTALAVPFAGFHGHEHAHLHKRQNAPAYGGDVSSEAAAATGEAPPSYGASSSVVDAVPAPSSGASAVVPASYGASSSVADAALTSSAAAASAPVYSYAPAASSSEANAVVPTAYASSSDASAVVSTSYASSAASSSDASAVVLTSYVSSAEASAVLSTSCTSSLLSSSEAEAVVPATYAAASSNAAFTYAPANSSSAAAVQTPSQSSIEEAATMPATYPAVSSSEAAATVPATYPAVSSSSDAANVPVQSDTETTTTVKQTRTTTLFKTVYLTSSSASQPAATQPAPAESKNENGAGQNTAPASYPAPTAAAEQCAAVTITATEKVTEYVTINPAGSTVASASGPNTVEITSTVYNNPSYSSATSEAAAQPTSSQASVSAPSYEAPKSSEAAAVSIAPSAPAYEAPKSSEAAAVSSAPSAPAYEAPKSSEAAAVSSAPSAPAYQAPVSSEAAAAPAPASSEAAVIPSAYADKGVVNAQMPSLSLTASISIASSTASAPPSYNTGSSSGGKRGLAYNDASLTTCFAGSSEITWAYNWGSSRDGLSSNLKFIPTLWGTREDFTSVWDANVKKAIADGADYVFSFNEPDHGEQSSMTPAAAAAAYQTYMNPLKGQAKLCAPSVTNGGGDMGLTWLQCFLDACSGNCEIDALNVHWYDAASNAADFKRHVQQAIDMAGGKPVWVSEFGATGSDEEISTFLEDVMPWMDSNSAVAGYAYFMVKDGDLVTGTEPSSYGSTYKTYTS